MESNTYTLIILDVPLSQHSGADILSAVRQLNDAPILALSEQASSAERVMALRCGADDVLNKPCDLDECLERALALMRRYNSENQMNGRSYTIVAYEDLLLDTARRKVSIAGNHVTMTRKEYEILLFLLTHRKQVLSYEQIYRNVWKEEFLGDNSVLNYHIHTLRKKLGSDWIETVYGIGYCMRSLY